MAHCAESNIPIDATIKVQSDDYESFEQLYKLTEATDSHDNATEGNYYLITLPTAISALREHICSICDKISPNNKIDAIA